MLLTVIYSHHLSIKWSFFRVLTKDNQQYANNLFGASPETQGVVDRQLRSRPTGLGNVDSI